MSFSFASDYDLSTRAHYGVYLRSFFFTCGIFSFQLAPSTECIIFGWYKFILVKISTRTLYGVYLVIVFCSLNTTIFQLAPLRSVSIIRYVFTNRSPLSTRTLTECIFTNIDSSEIEGTFNSHPYGVYQQNDLILCFKICHFLLHN